MKWVDLQSLLIKCDNELYGWLPDLQFSQLNSQSSFRCGFAKSAPIQVIYTRPDTAVVIYEIRQPVMMH